MTLKLYAHSLPDPDESLWEPLQDHLAAVAERAGLLAAPFGGSVLAHAMGALHDLGKANPAFQLYIRGRGSSVDHSTAGAAIAYQRYGAVLGRMMAFGIAGHHAGLANGRMAGGGLSSLNERLANHTPVPPAAEQDLAPATVELSAPVLSKGFTHDFSVPFLTRMLFSCLIDADRLETEAFYARANRTGANRTGANRTGIERGCPLTVADLRDRLDAHLAGFKDAAGPVNALRAEVLTAVRAKAEEAPGLFSLTVPTGGGKTLASLAFALDHAVRHGLRRVIYVIPFTSIVEQTADVFRKALGSDDAVLEHHSGFDAGPKAKRPTIGELDDEEPDGAAKLRLATENWDRPIVVTTAVQFFESLFSNRPSACRKLHAIAGAVVILDEAQTLPLPFLRPCLESLRELARGYRTSVVLCTATQPAITTEAGFAGGLETVRELAPNPRELYRRLKRVTVRRIEEPLDDAALAERLLAEPQALCIVNNRRHARDLLRLIAKEKGARHLSTCLCAKHRQAELAAIRRDLDPKVGRPVRLVATSLVEAGVDFSFPVVYRAMAGLDSIAQAAGRCNRNGELPEPGRVFVFTSPDGETRKPPPELSQFAEVAAGVLRTHDDPLALDTLRDYFQRLYWQRGPEELDAALVGEGTAPIRGILNALTLHRSDTNPPFADIARAFRIIDSPLVPVIVPYRPAEDPDAVERLLDTLRKHNIPAHKTGGIARALQPYLVQIPRKARSALLAAGAAECIREAELGDQFVSLINGDLYHPDVGLDWEDPTFRKTETCMF